MERCGFFDANLVGDEYDRVYLAEQFAAYFASFIGNGVFAGKSNKLQVLSMEAPAMQVRIQEGQGWINGYWYENMSELYVPIEVADGILSRVDSIVLRLGMTERNMWIAVKKGTPSYNPVAPEVTRNNDYFELQLATVWVGAGYTNIKQSDITDTRLDSDVCGFVASLIEQLDTTGLGAQLQGYIEKYIQDADVVYAGYTAKLDADYTSYAAKLDNDYKSYTDKIEELKNLASQDKNNYFADLQSLYGLCQNAYNDFLAYLQSLKTQGDDSLESLKSWIESLKQSSSTEISRLIEELRALISEEMVSELILRLSDLEQEMPKKVPKPVDSDLTEGLLYYNSSDGTTRLVEDREQLKKFKYSIILDMVDGNPAAIEYADDCSGFVEARFSNMGDWANTDLYRNYFKPCVIAPEDSEPKYFLQQDNMTLKEDGTPAVLDGTDGDVMIQVKKLYGKITNIGTKVKFTLLNYKEDDSCFCFNEIDGSEKDYIYIAAFACSKNMGASSYKSVIVDTDEFWNFTVNPLYTDVMFYSQFYSQEDGPQSIPQGYLPGYYYLTYALYQWMFLLLYKSRNAQSVFGVGYVMAATVGDVLGEEFVFGSTANKPFCHGTGSVYDNQFLYQYQHTKFLGIEDFYGSGADFIDGIFFQRKLLDDDTYVSYFGFSKSPSKYAAMHDVAIVDEKEFDSVSTIVAQYTNSDESANENFYLKDVNMDAGIICPVFKQSEASSETFWCDNVEGLMNTFAQPTISNFVSAGAYFSSADSLAASSILGPFAFLLGMETGSTSIENTTVRLCRYV